MKRHTFFGTRINVSVGELCPTPLITSLWDVLKMCIVHEGQNR
jgi:hypothetical protein